MSGPRILDDLQARLEKVFSTGPARDIERNVKTAVANALGRFDVASRDELDIQRKMLARANERIAALEARLAALEAKQDATPR